MQYIDDTHLYHFLALSAVLASMTTKETSQFLLLALQVSLCRPQLTAQYRVVNVIRLLSFSFLIHRKLDIGKNHAIAYGHVLNECPLKNIIRLHTFYK